MSTKMKRGLLILAAAVFVCAACSKKTGNQTAENPQVQEQLELGEKYLSERKYGEAIAAFEKCLGIDGENVDAYLRLADVYLEMDNMEAALDILEQGYVKTEDDALKTRYAEICTEMANEYYDDEDFDSAIEAFERAVGMDDTYIDAYLGLYDLYLYLEEYTSADEVLARGCEATNDAGLIEKRYASLSELGQWFIEEENYEEAIPCLERILEAGRGDDSTRLSLSTAYSWMEEHEKAIQILESMENQEDDSVKSALAVEYALYGEQCFDDGEDEAAVANLRKAIELNPNGLDAYVVLISVYLEQGNMDEAGKVVAESTAKFLNAEASSSGRFEDFLGVVSEYYAEKDDLDACLNFWEKAAALKPDNEGFKAELEGYRSSAADEAYMKAEELLANGDVNGAMSHFKRAAALAPAYFEDGLISTDNGTYCLNKDGSFKLGWYDAGDGDTYYFNPAGGSSYGCSVMGWQTLDGSEYYFMDDGRMLTEEETPDGFYVGADGKKVDNGQAPTEAEEDEPEEEEPADEEDEPETSSAGRPTASASSNNGKLQLNTELLQQAKDSDGRYAVTKEELFNNLGDGGLTLNDIYNCMSQYGMKVQWILEESTYELGMGDMIIWVFPGSSLTETGVVVKDAAKYRESLRAKTLPDGTTFAVQFDAKATGTNETVDIEKIEKVNNK